MTSARNTRRPSRPSISTQAWPARWPGASTRRTPGATSAPSATSTSRPARRRQAPPARPSRPASSRAPSRGRSRSTNTRCAGMCGRPAAVVEVEVRQHHRVRPRRAGSTGRQRAVQVAWPRPPTPSSSARRRCRPGSSRRVPRSRSDVRDDHMSPSCRRGHQAVAHRQRARLDQGGRPSQTSSDIWFGGCAARPARARRPRPCRPGSCARCATRSAARRSPRPTPACAGRRRGRRPSIGSSA